MNLWLCFSNLYDLSRDARLHADEGLLLLRRALRGMLLGLQNEHAFDVAVGAVADLPGLLGEADADRSHQHTLQLLIGITVPQSA